MSATDPTYSDYDAAQHAAAPLSDPAAGPRALRASVLYYFGGGLDVRNAASGDADFDWNREDGNRRRLLDLLALAEDANPRPAGEDADIIHAMADYALVRNANCGGATAARTRRVCTGASRIANARASLVAEVNKAPGAADTAVVLALLDEEGAHPNIEDSVGRSLLILAARNGHADDCQRAGCRRGGCERGGSGLSQFWRGPPRGVAAERRKFRRRGGSARAAGVGVVSFRRRSGRFATRRRATRPLTGIAPTPTAFAPLDLLVDSSDRVAEVIDRPLLQDMADYLIARGRRMRRQDGGPQPAGLPGDAEGAFGRGGKTGGRRRCRRVFGAAEKPRRRPGLCGLRRPAAADCGGAQRACENCQRAGGRGGGCERDGSDFCRCECRPSLGDSPDRPGGRPARAAGVGVASFRRRAGCSQGGVRGREL